MVAPVGEQTIEAAFTTADFEIMYPDLPDDRRASCAKATANVLRAIAADGPNQAVALETGTCLTSAEASEASSVGEQPIAKPYDGIIPTYRRNQAPRPLREQPAPSVSDVMLAIGVLRKAIR